MADADGPRLPTRYRELRSRARANGLGGERALEQELGALLRSVAEPQALSAAELAEVRFRLAQRAKGSRISPRFRERALVFAFLILGASVASAGMGLLELVSEPRVERSASSDATRAPRSTQRARSHAAPLSAPASVSSAEAPEVIPEPEQVTDGRQGRAHSGFEVEASEASTSDKKQVEQRALTLESIALGRALTKLRRERDPSAALVLFDQYAAEFPNGALQLESRVARIDALLALGRKSQALSELGAIPLQGVARGPELRLLRAELWAERDCQRALTDFQALLDGATSGSIAERALHGRAVCRLKLGDRARAASDLRTYLERYPEGAFAKEVRASLSSESLE